MSKFEIVDLTDDAVEFVDRKYVCDRYRVTAKTVGRWQAQGKITAFRVAGSQTLRYDKAEIDALARVVEQRTPGRVTGM